MISPVTQLCITFRGDTRYNDTWIQGDILDIVNPTLCSSFKTQQTLEPCLLVLVDIRGECWDKYIQTSKQRLQTLQKCHIFLEKNCDLSLELMQRWLTNWNSNICWCCCDTPTWIMNLFHSEKYYIWNEILLLLNHVIFLSELYNFTDKLNSYFHTTLARDLHIHAHSIAP